MENGQVTIIVPVYNAKKYISKCLDSIINQTYSDLEIIVIDDGSKDGTTELVKGYVNRDKRISLIVKENEGVGIARNTGIESAKGEYITFVDADDWIDEDFIETLVAKIGDADVAVGRFKPVIEDENFSRRFTHFEADEVIDREHFFKHCLEDYTYTFVCWGKLYKKSALAGIRFLPMPFSEDSVFCREVLGAAKGVSLVNVEGYNYRITFGGVTQDRSRIEERAVGSVLLRYKTIEIYGDGKKETKDKLFDEARHIFTLYLRRAARYKIHDKKVCRDMIKTGTEKFKGKLRAFDKMLIAVIKMKTI